MRFRNDVLDLKQTPYNASLNSIRSYNSREDRIFKLSTLHRCRPTRIPLSKFPIRRLLAGPCILSHKYSSLFRERGLLITATYLDTVYPSRRPSWTFRASEARNALLTINFGYGFKIVSNVSVSWSVLTAGQSIIYARSRSVGLQRRLAVSNCRHFSLLTPASEWSCFLLCFLPTRW